MISERELVGLLYRADWTKLTLSGTVSAPTEPAVDTRVTVRSDEPLSWPWQPEPGPPVPPWLSETEKEAWEARDGWTSRPSWYFLAGSKDVPCTLSVAPGRRFLAEHPDGPWAAGSDGERLWYWFRDRPAGKFAGFDDRPGPPYRSLLAPSWLLTGYSLVIDGEVTVAGRAGVRVRGTLRTAAARTPGIVGHLGAGGLSAPIPRWINADQGDEVEAVVDAELGILLRCSQRSADRLSQVTEFTSVDVARAGTSAFSPPPGSVFGGKGSGTRGPRDRPADGAGTSLGDALGEALGAAGKEAAKTVAGMAAGGLGALIRYAPRRQRADPFAQATAEAADPEAQMPADEPAPGGPDGGAAPALADEVLPDEVLHLLYRSGLTAAPFSAALHQWLDVGAALASIPRSARDRGFGGVGFLVDTVMRDLANEPGGANHEVSTVRMGGWNEYLINVVRPVADAASSRSGPSRSGHGDKNQLRAIASDGARQWQVFADRVLTGDAAPPPCDLADLVDASWLLYGSLDLSGGSEVWLAGRRAYRIVARYREETLLGSTGWLERLFFPAVAVVDAETGLVLRLTRFRGGRPAARRELRDVTPLEPEASFGFTPPDGLPVRDAETPREQSPWERWARSTGRPD
jgi:hypothetical protein